MTEESQESVQVSKPEPMEAHPTLAREVKRVHLSRVWGQVAPWLLPGVVTAALCVLLGFLLVLVLTPLARLAPVSFHSLESQYLGAFCPGQEVNARNEVTVNQGEVIIYYFGVKYADGLTDVPSSTQSFPASSYPKGGTFTQTLKWTVPDLEPGKYVRTTTARGADGRRKAAMLSATFIIKEKEKCPDAKADEQSQHSWPLLGRDLGLGWSPHPSL